MLDELGRLIVTGEYESKAFPIEAELSVRFGVSRSVTREAVKMLTAKGILSARPRQGTSIQPKSSWNLFDSDVLRWLLDCRMTPELVRQLCQLRIAIEPAAAALAAEAANAGAIADIAAAYHQMEAAAKGSTQAIEADIAFHLSVLQASGNPFYAQFRDLVANTLRASIGLTSRMRGHTTAKPAGRQRFLLAHYAVYVAIRDGKPSQAREAMEEHITASTDLVERTIRQQASQSGGRR
jgi:DNA-binding FadR family transcriptional regulator